MIFIRMPEPRESATVSAIPRAAASAKEVDTEERSFSLWYLPEKSYYNHMRPKLSVHAFDQENLHNVQEKSISY